jgi:protease-4
MKLPNFLQRASRRTDLRASDRSSERSIETDDLKSAIGEALIADLIRERRSERNWKHIKRIVISGSAVVLFGIYVGFYVTSLGYHVVPNSDIVGVVRVTGAIEEGSPTASADTVIPALAKAFSKPNVKAIVIAIDSPGGKPGESERIYNYIDAKRKETGKPVYSVISNTGASAAYMIAVHTDKIYAGKYSIVGSIGAIMQSWDFHKVAERFEVQHKIYASGALKGMLDPWNSSTPEAEAKAQDMVNSMGKRFAKEVVELRGAKLAKNVNLFTGEVWTGDEAKALGLVDEVNTLDSMVKEVWHLGYHDFGPVKSGSGFNFPFMSIADSVVDAFAESIARKLGFTSTPLN